MNMLHRTVRAGSEKARIWEICDELYARDGRVPSGREVVDLYVAEGGNPGTGFTQYSHWKKEVSALAEAEEDSVETHPASVPFRAMTISADGHLALPPDMRKAMLLDRDGRVTVSVVDGELRAISPMSAVHQLQRRAASLVPAGTLVSDELIAERRVEADRNG
jgi:hypothetical protein